MQFHTIVFLCLTFSQIVCLTDEEAKTKLCGTDTGSLDGAVVVTNPIAFSTLCGIGDGDCKDVFPMTDFGIPLECSQVVKNNKCGEAEIIKGDFCALSCQRCAKCQTTLKGCSCQKDWVYQITGETFNGCQFPDNDPQGPWCLVDTGTCQTPPAGKTFDYCDRQCVEGAGVPAPAQESQGQGQGVPTTDQNKVSLDQNAAYDVTRSVTLDGQSDSNASITASPPLLISPPISTPTPTPPPPPTPSSNSPGQLSETSLQDNNNNNNTQGVTGAPSKNATSDIVDEWLSAHNKYRAQHCSGDLQWDNNLASIAQQGASTCDPDAPAIGNQIEIFGDVSPTDVVASWYSDVARYDFSNGSPGGTALTQVLWKSSQRVGCGISDKCDNGGFLVICVYDPVGNSNGKYLENVLPQSCGSQWNDTSLERVTTASAATIFKQASPEPSSGSAWTDAHNVYRQQHCVDDLKWNSKLADESQKLASTCTTDQVSGNNGRNVYKTTAPSITAQEVVKFWYEQGSGYNFDNPVYNASAGTLTQVIWKDSREVGCGMSEACSDGNLYVYCLYNPSGNIASQISQNIQKICK